MNYICRPDHSPTTATVTGRQFTLIPAAYLELYRSPTNESTPPSMLSDCLGCAADARRSSSISVAIRVPRDESRPLLTWLDPLPHAGHLAVFWVGQMIPIGSAVALIYRSKASGIPVVLTVPHCDWYVCARQNRGYFADADMRDRRVLKRSIRSEDADRAMSGQPGSRRRRSISGSRSAVSAEMLIAPL